MEENIYVFPDKEILIKSKKENDLNIEDEKKKIENFFESFNIKIECINVYRGINSITYEIDLKSTIKLSTIKSYKEDIMLKFNAINVEFIIAINGTNHLGIQIINKNNEKLFLGDLINEIEFNELKQEIPIIIGKDLNNKLIVEDLTELPHLLIAGTTGTGKSNFIRTLIIDFLYRFNPSELKMILVDTRNNSFINFGKIQHLLIPIITDSKKSSGALAWVVMEMENRYQLFASKEVRDLKEYNRVAIEKGFNQLPKIVIIIEDLADLMMNVENDVKESICRLAQKSRAAGIHLIISTQRSSIDVINGVIKSNIPSRIAFRVPAQIDSKTIIDTIGAEKLQMNGEVLLKKIGDTEIKRIQTPYISENELERILDDIKNKNMENYYGADILKSVYEFNNNEDIDVEDDTDPLLMEVIEEIVQMQQASTSLIQRKFKIGYARAGRIMDQLEERGIISGYMGSKPREVLMSVKRWKKSM